MRKLLFVDDEPIMRELYQDLENDLGMGHEIQTASNGAEALERMAREKFDIVVSDLTMPDMPGLDFLARVMHAHPTTARIVISGYAEHIKAAEALNVAHRYFRKPVDLPSFGGLLKRLCHYDYLLASDHIRKMVFQTGALPVLPETYLKLSKLLNSSFADMNDIAAVVEQDPGIASKLLQTVNSAHFGVARRIVSCTEAIQIVGIEVVRSLIIGNHIFDFYKDRPFVASIFPNLWAHSINTAIGARKIAESENQTAEESNVAFISGLLHDVGKLILAANAEREYKLVLDLAAKTSVSLEEAELGIFATSHAQIGAYLLALWGFPDTVVEAVNEHHTLNVTSFDPSLAIHIAQSLEPGSEQRNRLNVSLIQELGLEPQIEKWAGLIGNRG